MNGHNELVLHYTRLKGLSMTNASLLGAFVSYKVL
jgi:hypothetical protein